MDLPAPPLLNSLLASVIMDMASLFFNFVMPVILGLMLITFCIRFLTGVARGGKDFGGAGKLLLPLGVLAFVVIAGPTLITYTTGYVIGSGEATQTPVSETPGPTEVEPAPSSPVPTDAVGPEQTNVAPTDTSEPGESTPVSDLPWGWLLFGFVAVVLIAVAVLIVYHAGSVGRKRIAAARAERAAREEQRARYAEQWQELRDRGTTAVESWLAYETDLALLLQHPVMADLTDPVIQRVVRAMSRVRRLLRYETAPDRDAPVVGSPFWDAVHDMERALTAARRHAEKVRFSRFDKDEQKRLRTAQQLLARALDASNHPSERHLAYERVIKILEGLLPVPEKALAALAAQVEVTPALGEGMGLKGLQVG